MAIAVEFDWTRAYSKSPGEPAYVCRNEKIYQVGRGKQQYSPLKNGSLYLQFAQLDGSAKSCVAFAEACGLLTHPVSMSAPPSEDLAFWRGEVKRMRSLIRALPVVVKTVNSRGTYAKIGTVDVLLVPGTGPDARPVMVMEPANLLQAMNLELAQAVAGGAALLTCQYCGQWFAAGRGGKRTVAKFCSDEHRFRFNNDRRTGK
jgi:hypothetical protein